MTNEQLQAIRARLEAATPGPWTFGRNATDEGLYIISCDGKPEEGVVVYSDAGIRYQDDAEFIAAAREDVPALLAEVDTLRRWTVALQAELDQVRQERDRARQALHVQDREATGLYDCYGQPIK